MNVVKNDSEDINVSNTPEEIINTNTGNDRNDSQSTDKKDINKEDLIANLRKIFFNFGRFQQNENEFLLPYQGVLKIIKAINIIDDKYVKLSDIDIIFKKVNPSSKKLNEKQFFDFFVFLASKVDPAFFKQDQKGCINNVFRLFFEPFITYIDEKRVSMEEVNSGVFIFKGIETFLSEYEFDYKIASIINNIYFALKEIYLVYFHYELNSYTNIYKIIEGSTKSLIEFVKDFELVPYSMNMNQIVVYYNLIINQLNNEHSLKQLSTLIEPKKDLGSVFTFSRFAMMIIHFSEITFAKFNHLNVISVAETGIFLIIFFVRKIDCFPGKT